MGHNRRDHIDHRHRRPHRLLNRCRRRGRGGIARDHNGLASGIHEVFGNPHRPGANQLRGAVAVGHVRGVPEVMETLCRPCLRQGMGDRQAADAGIKNPDGGLRGQAWP